MEKLKFPIYFSTVFLVIYTVITRLESIANLSLILFTLSPIAILWLAYKILKDGIPSGKTFTERFYDDHDYQRIEVRELN